MLSESIYIPRVLDTGTCIQQGDLFFSATQEPVSVALTQKKLRRGFGKNAGEWPGRVEISMKEIHNR